MDVLTRKRAGLVGIVKINGVEDSWVGTRFKKLIVILFTFNTNVCRIPFHPQCHTYPQVHINPIVWTNAGRLRKGRLYAI